MVCILEFDRNFPFLLLALLAPGGWGLEVMFDLGIVMEMGGATLLHEDDDVLVVKLHGNLH